MSDASPAPRRGPLPPVVFLAAIALMACLHVFLPLARVVPDGWRFLGVLLIGAGLGLNVWADSLFKRAGTTVKPFQESAALVVTGPFAFTRNPMYVGMILVLAGVAAGLGSGTPWLVMPLFVWQVRDRFIRTEERMLESTFGAAFRDYKARVRRWW